MGIRFSFLLPSRFFCVLALPLVLLLSPQSVTALDVKLAWNANIEQGIAGYRVFMRQEGKSYDYLRPEWIGWSTVCKIYSLDDETNYCFVVRAYDSYGTESGDSNEACTDYLDSNPPVHPGAKEGPVADPTCFDRVDNDDDGLTDMVDPDCILPCGYSRSAEASVHGTGGTVGSGALGQLVIFLIPLAQIVLLKRLRRKKR
jgi:hypothetical protein